MGCANRSCRETTSNRDAFCMKSLFYGEKLFSFSEEKSALSSLRLEINCAFTSKRQLITRRSIGFQDYSENAISLIVWMGLSENEGTDSLDDIVGSLSSLCLYSCSFCVN